MIRPTHPSDRDALLELLSAAGLFDADELEPIQQMLTSWFEAPGESGGQWITDEDDRPVGVAYFAPEAMADGAWNLYLIAVHPDRHGQGRGTALMRHVEETGAAEGARLLLVETSGLPQFERTRAFYERRGYEREARIRDFYAPGDDKIVYRKALR